MNQSNVGLEFGIGKIVIVLVELARSELTLK